ncbi:hypothetical protein IKT18_00525 [Candidatus Saccharibacteria bacterium]|nr:hypothetical protein [Candidatus Saccharibacteria bacterium]
MTEESSAKRIGELLKQEMVNDPRFYFFSPDETTSNKFTAVYDVESRAWDLPIKEWDLPESPKGRIVEMLSENVLFSTMMGHLMNGEQAMMGSYESFFPIVASQLLQQIKFIKQSKSVPWRESLPAVNLLSTSVCWRQDHNGFTHQSPALISTLLSVPSDLVNCIFPADAVVAEEAFKFMLTSRDVVNFTTFDKNELPVYFDEQTAHNLFEGNGATIYEPLSDEEPDFVLAAAGDIATREAMEAVKILREDLPGLRIRLVIINALSYRAIGTTEHKMSREQFNKMFTTNRPIIAIFHGYPAALETIFEKYTDSWRLRVHGFSEEGSTTTPFEMLRKNASTRFDLAIDVAKALKFGELVEKYQKILEENHAHAIEFGEDLIK